MKKAENGMPKKTDSYSKMNNQRYIGKQFKEFQSIPFDSRT